MEVGTTKLNAVIEMLAAIDIKTVTALDTGGASDAADAERFLDFETLRIQMQGFEDNTDLCRAFTANGSGQIEAAANWLVVMGAGPHAYRNLTIRTGYVWDADQHTTTITTASATVYLNVIYKLDWADCSPRLKNAILASAIQKFQRRMKGDPQTDLQLQGENTMAQLLADHPRDRNGDAARPISKFPILRPQGGQQGPMNG